MLDENNTASGPQQFSKDKFCGIEVRCNRENFILCDKTNNNHSKNDKTVYIEAFSSKFRNALRK